MSAKLAEDPWIKQGPTAHGNARAAGCQKHALGVGDGTDVAVADNRHFFHRFDDRADTVELDRAAKALFARSAMDDNGGHACLLELARETRGAPIAVIPAQAHLDGHRNTNGFN